MAGRARAQAGAAVASARGPLLALWEKPSPPSTCCILRPRGGVRVCWGAFQAERVCVCLHSES